MKDKTWEKSLAALDKDIKKLKTVSKHVKQLEKVHDRYGTNPTLKRKMTLTNFDEFIED